MLYGGALDSKPLCQLLLGYSLIRRLTTSELYSFLQTVISAFLLLFSHAFSSIHQFRSLKSLVEHWWSFWRTSSHLITWWLVPAPQSDLQLRGDMSSLEELPLSYTPHAAQLVPSPSPALDATLSPRDSHAHSNAASPRDSLADEAQKDSERHRLAVDLADARSRLRRLALELCAFFSHCACAYGSRTSSCLSSVDVCRQSQRSQSHSSVECQENL